MNILKTTVASSSLVVMLFTGASQAVAEDSDLQTMFKGGLVHPLSSSPPK